MNDNAKSSRAMVIARRWRAALVISLALNLFLAGLIGVWVLKPIFTRPPAQPEVERIIDRMAGRLQAPDAAILRGVYDRQRDTLTTVSTHLHEARERMRASLRANPFDAAALQKSMDDVRNARMEFMKALEGIIMESAQAMSPNGRQALARGPQRR